MENRFYVHSFSSFSGDLGVQRPLCCDPNIFEQIFLEGKHPLHVDFQDGHLCVIHRFPLKGGEGSFSKVLPMKGGGPQFNPQFPYKKPSKLAQARNL